MQDDRNASRRDFIKQSSLGLGAGFLNISDPFIAPERTERYRKLPRELRIATIDLKGITFSDTIDTRMEQVLGRMQEVAEMKPDIICLPELFSTMWVKQQRPLKEVAEDETVPGPMTGRIGSFAKQHNCYIVCPVYTKRDGDFYNSSLLIDRKGAITGVYHKIHPVKTEIFHSDVLQGGVLPGALEQPVITTDFGKVGMQICYDANWSDGWENYAKQGADIVFFSSAFPAGRMLNYYASKHNYYIVSSTAEDARVIDISGNDLDITSEFVRYAWATVNLEKVVAATWPTNNKLASMFRKYRDRVAVKVWANAELITIESRDPGLKVRNVLKEFNILTYLEQLKHESEEQEKYRPVTTNKFL